MRTSITATSSRPRLFQKASAVTTAGILAFTCVMAHAPVAHAVETGEVSPTGKGIVGGALLGGEVVTIVEALAGVKPTWLYLLGGGLGAVGGGIGGYFVEQSSTNGRVPVYMLAGGLGLLIPAIVLTLNATRYMPSEDATEDHAPTNLPPADPGAPSNNAVGAPIQTNPPAAAPAPGAPSSNGSPTTPATPPGGGGTSGGGGPPALPLSLFQMNGGTMRLGLPIPEVRPVYSMSDLKQYGMAQQTEVRMPLVKVVF